jgi:predicted DsbA family dithiol-disulfide isomerase
MQARLKKVASEEGLPFGDREKTYNSRLAQELAKWAESQGLGDAFHDEIFRAYFAEGKNIGRRSVLIDLAQSVGLSAEQAKEILKTRAFASEVDVDWRRARDMGVTAVPTFFLNAQFLVGAQQYQVLEQFLNANNVEKHAPS